METTESAQELRRIGVGVGAIIHDPACTHFLMLQRGPQCRDDIGLWEFPGGAQEFGESLQAAVRREVHEEIGVLVQPNHAFHPTEIVVPNGAHVHGFSFLCWIIQGEPQIQEPQKCTDLRWFTLRQIEALQIDGELSRWAARDLPKLQAFVAYYWDQP